MTYKAQLVVRARSKDGAAIIEKVKEMAGEQDKTYSEMAVELLGRGLNADEDVDQTFSAEDDDASADDEQPEEPVDDVEDDEVEPVVADDDTDSDTDADANAPLPPEEAGPAVDPSLPPEEIVEHYVERRDERGDRAAARILVDFFAEAGPVEGGELKNLLQEEFSDDVFDELMEPIKRTDEYKSYTRRVLNKPSPYSDAR